MKLHSLSTFCKAISLHMQNKFALIVGVIMVFIAGFVVGQRNASLGSKFEGAVSPMYPRSSVFATPNSVSPNGAPITPAGGRRILPPQGCPPWQRQWGEANCNNARSGCLATLEYYGCKPLPGREPPPNCTALKLRLDQECNAMFTFCMNDLNRACPVSSSPPIQPF